MIARTLPLLLVTVLAAPLPSRADEPDDRPADVVIYGGTSAGVIAAVQVARMGRSVVLIEPRQHVGGLTVSGLGWTDTGNKAVIGGLARAFYRRVKQHYDDESQWTREDRAGYSRYRPADDAMWTFEPHVAERILQQMLREAGVPVVLGERLDREGGVRRDGTRIVSLTMESGRTFSGRQFLDCTYEGDLMAAAGVSFTVGRESNDTYGETLDGVQKARATKHQFTHPVDPYVTPGDPSSGLLPGINTSPGEDGAADHRVQAYNYRLCLTDVPENQIPFARPDDYDPQMYELLLRNFEAGDLRLPLKIDMMPNRKTDVNNRHAVSTDFIGMNYEFPEADYAERERIRQQHESYTRGLMWTLASHPRVPEEIRREVGRWGWALDEYTDNHHWPYWPYIREARRMVSDTVHTENDCRRTRPCPDPVGMGSYNMDSHNVQRYVDEAGHVRNEGDVQVSPGGPYLISYRTIVPRASECTNLLVPVCLSSSHIAYGSIRMEPVFMILGQSAATAACLAIDEGTSVQQLDYARLRARLDADGQVLEIPAGSLSPTGLDPKQLPGLVVDDLDAEKTGTWHESRSIGGFVGTSYLHDGHELPGSKSIRFNLPIPSPGRYEVRLAYTPNPNRATNVPVTILHAGGRSTTKINQKRRPPLSGTFVPVGTFRFDPAGESAVILSNESADGHVIADAVQLVPE